MIRYIPDFIVNSYESGNLSGSLNGYLLLFDITDFTPIGTELQKQGKQGAEELSRFLDIAFSEPIAIVLRYGGFVSLFAGDAFCAIFPEAKGESIVSVVNSIRAFFYEHSEYKAATGSFRLEVRLTVAWGDISWQIFENDLQNEYVFYGDTVAELASLASLREEQLFSERAARQIGTELFDKLETGYRLNTSEITASTNPHAYHYSPDTKAKFIHSKYVSEQPQNEFRSGAFCFANLESIAPDKRNHCIATIQNLAGRYGGFVNKYDATDKGLVGIILFGLPRSEGKTLQRICEFSLELINLEPNLALGICCGTVYAGFTGSKEIKEYTALGHPLNLAARLMSKASPGEIYTESGFWKELSKDYHFGYLGTLELKGIQTPVSYYRLNHRIEQNTGSQEFRFVGRSQELGQIREQIQASFDNRTNAIIYVSGDPGIGKSRLVKEALSYYQTSEFHFFKASCNAVIKYPLDAIKQIVRSYCLYDRNQTQEAGIKQYRRWWAELAGDDKELIRIESIIASLLDYEWDSSVWSMLPPLEKPTQLTTAIIDLFIHLTKTKPVLIHLDDGQWLDDESKEILQILSHAGASPLVIVSPCRYLDDGSKVDLELSKHVRIDIELGNMSEQGCGELIQSILNLDIVPSETMQLIAERSMGNPLFVEQLSAYLLENGILDDQGTISQEVGYLSSFSISDIVGSRIDRLSAKVRESMYGASVLGLEFNIKVLSKMLNCDQREELETGIDSRIWKELDELRYIFTHILIKDIVYQRMLSGKLQLLHNIAAQAMETVFADKLDEMAEEIALHYDKAGVAEKAAYYYDKAGCWFRIKFVYSKSEQYLEKALDIREKTLGAEHKDTAVSLHHLAMLYWNLAHYDKAEPLYLKSLDIYNKVLGPEHPDTVVGLHHLAIMYWNQGLFDQAEPLLMRTLELFKQNSGTEDSNTAASLAGLGELYSQQGKYEQAEPLLLQALQIYEKVLPAEHPDIATTLNSLAIMYDEEGKYDQAEPLHLRALNIREKVVGEEHPDTAASLNNLALVYQNQGLYAQAEPLYLRALHIFETVLGAEHPNTAASLEGLGELMRQQGKYDKAEPLYLHSLEILSKVLGAEHPWTIQAATGLVELYELMGESEKAAPYKALLSRVGGQ